MDIKTGSWFGEVPTDHIKIGISRGVPRRMPAGYRVYRKLAPGSWFQSVSAEEYYHRYRTEILAPLDPRVIAAELIDLARGAVPVMVCYEKAGGPDWCHRAMTAEWLAEALGRPIPEVGLETLSQADHPLMPPGLAREIPQADAPDLTRFVGREAWIDGELHRVVGIAPHDPRRAIIIVSGTREFPAGLDTLQRHFGG